jgi:release factor glutamine methyltransferase
MEVSSRDVVGRLAAAGCVAAHDEARALVAAAPDPGTLEAWIRRRESGEPLAWITGRVEFGGLVLRAAPGVYVPRPQTEELARRAAAALPCGGRALDLCTGVGAVAAVLTRHDPTARIVGTERDRRAAAAARGNGIRVVVTDVADAIGGDAAWDVVTAIAPYVPTASLRLLPSDVLAHEPRRALDGGADGLALVRRVVDAGSRLLRTGGALLTEVGGDQDAVVVPLLAAAGFDAVTPWRDEDGDLRGIRARRTGRP